MRRRRDPTTAHALARRARSDCARTFVVARKTLIRLARRPGTPVANAVAMHGHPARRHRSKEFAMNWDRIEGNWTQLKGKVKEQWGRLTDDDLDVVAGRKDQLVGRIQEQYGISREEAEKQVDRFGDRFRDDDFRH